MRILPILFLIILAVLLTGIAGTANAAPAQPLAPRCVGAGPLPLDDPTFCGCTWGEVYYRGQPVAGATVTLQFGNGITHTVTSVTDVDANPYYDLTGFGLGAQAGDVMTVTAEFAGLRATRLFRAQPDEGNSKEQHVPLVLVEDGNWQTLLGGTYTRTLTAYGDMLWAANSNTVRSVDLTNQLSTTLSLPSSIGSVRSLAIEASTGHPWLAGSGGVAEFDGAGWQDRTAPVTGVVQTLAFDPNDGALWAGTSLGEVARYQNGWQVITQTLGGPVQALAKDDAGGLWVSVTGRGVFRKVGEQWSHYRAADGFVSDTVNAIVVDRTPNQNNQNSIWFAARSYLSGVGEKGGIARYDLNSNEWRIFSEADGLPADSALPSLSANVHSLTIDSQGTVWAGTEAGVYVLGGNGRWINAGSTQTALLLANQVNKLFAAELNQVRQLDRTQTVGGAPTATITSTSKTAALTDQLTLHGTARDADESQNAILAWEWRSDQQPLCTTAAICQVAAGVLGEGVHTISLRVQDDEGTWSQPATTQVTVVKNQTLFLPLLER
ncbi:MAG: hypothetical protein U0175_23940 [Caldilineaceae bacterium]